MGCGYSDTFGPADLSAVGGLMWHHRAFVSVSEASCCGACCAPPAYRHLLAVPAGPKWTAALSAGFDKQLDAAADQVVDVPMTSAGAGGRWRRVDVHAAKNALERHWLSGANTELSAHGLRVAVHASVLHTYNGSGPTTLHTLALYFFNTQRVEHAQRVPDAAAFAR